MARPCPWAPSAAPSPLHATVNDILRVLFIAESSQHVQGKSPEQDGGGGDKHGQPIEAQRTTVPACSTDCPPVIAHAWPHRPTPRSQQPVGGARASARGMP